MIRFVSSVYAGLFVRHFILYAETTAMIHFVIAVHET